MRTPNPRILCVERNSDTCLLLAVMLGLTSFDVRCVSTTAEGLALARSEPFDLYLLDGLLCDGTGAELCEGIRKFDPVTPVVFFSALAEERHRQQAMEAGATAYLIKPNDLEKLAGTVTSIGLRVGGRESVVRDDSVFRAMRFRLVRTSWLYQVSLPRPVALGVVLEFHRGLTAQRPQQFALVIPVKL
jgi:DNA-binding response OmpR family regulator